MDTIPFLPFILQSFPESLIILTLGLLAIGLKPNFKKTVAAVSLATIFSYVIRSLPIAFGIHSVLQLVFLIIMTIFLLKHSPFQAIIAVLLGSLALGLSESLMVPIIIAISGITFQEILANPWLRVVVPLPYTFLLGMLAYLIYKRNWVPLTLDKIETLLPKLHKPLYYLIVIGFLQGFLFVLINLTFYNAEYYITAGRQTLTGITNIILISSAVITMIVAYFMLQVGQKETQLEAEYRHLQGMQNIYLAVRQQRHDFINHVMSLYGLLKTEKNAAASTYIETICADVSKSQMLLNIGIPGLSGMLDTKCIIAEKKGINLEISADPGFPGIPIRPNDLTGIIGNLVDNALDAAQPVDTKVPSILIELLQEEGIFTIVVENTGQPLAPEIKDKIFKAGYTTKAKDDHTGLGLYTVSNLVEKYNGKIEFNSPKRHPGVRFMVIIPQEDRGE